MEQISLGQWLRERCKEENLSLREAAGKTGLCHSTIADIINGSSASPETIKKLSRAFGGNGRHGLVLEDKLLILARYRTPRPDEAEPNELLAQLIDKLSQLSQPQLEMIRHFTTFISEMEGK